MKSIALDTAWKFYRETTEEPPFMTISRKNQEAEGYAARAFNAAHWQDVTLPHDWAAALPYDEAASNRHGHRAVTAPPADDGDAYFIYKHKNLQFSVDN